MPDIPFLKNKERITLGADGGEASIIGTTPTLAKNMSFLKETIQYTQIVIEIELKTDNVTNPAICRVRHDGLGGDDLVFQTSSLSYVTFTGTIDSSGFSTGRHTFEFYLEDGSGETATLRETWAYGNV